MRKILKYLWSMLNPSSFHNLQVKSALAIKAFTDARDNLDKANKGLLKVVTNQNKKAEKERLVLEKKLANIAKTTEAAEAQRETNAKLANKIDKLLND